MSTATGTGTLLDETVEESIARVKATQGEASAAAESVSEAGIDADAAGLKDRAELSALVSEMDSLRASGKAWRESLETLYRKVIREHTARYNREQVTVYLKALRGAAKLKGEPNKLLSAVAEWNGNFILADDPLPAEYYGKDGIRKWYEARVESTLTKLKKQFERLVRDKKGDKGRDAEAYYEALIEQLQKLVDVPKTV